MGSPKPYASMSEELSEVQVLDSNDPLVTASSSVPSSGSARVMDSIEPLVPTARVQVLDSNDPLLLSCVSSVFEPVAGPSGMAGPSGVAASSSGSLPAVASSSEDEDEDIAFAMPWPTGSSSKRINLHSDELRTMWNWRKIGKLGTHDRCVQFAEERGLIPRQKMCSYHRSPMTLSKESGQVGKFRCRKRNCRTKQASRAIGTWFENARLPLTLIFQIMYAFCEGLTYHQTRKELLSYDDGPVVSTRTVAEWFSYCRETIALYVLEDQSPQGKIGGPNKVVQIEQSKFGTRKYNRGRHIEGHWVIGMIEDGSDDVRLEVCPDNESSADILVPLIITKHVEEGSIIQTDDWRVYLSLPQHGFTHRRAIHTDPTNQLVASDGTHTQFIESQWRGLKKQLRQQQNKHNFTGWLCEYSWRRTIMVNHLDAFEELLNAIKYVYKLD